MPVQSFTDVYPPARFDSLPWTQVRIEEASTEDGSYVAIETQAIAVDPTPATPNPLNITTEEAVADDWFRFVFIDANADESFPSDPINRTSVGRIETQTAADIQCTVADVSSLLHGRINDPDVNVFTDGVTTPTATQVTTAIALQAGEVFARCESIPAKQVGFAKSVVALATALAIERGFFPQETGNTDSITEALAEEFGVKITRLENLCKLATARVMA